MVVKNLREVANRWTPTLVKDGWTPVADFFLDNYHRLNPPISNPEAMLVIHLLRHKWDASPPFPGLATMARRMGISVTAVRSHARSLEKKGFLQRHAQAGTTNRFHLEPLFDALESLRNAVPGDRLDSQSSQGLSTKVKEATV